jgi:hypothetical protein
VSPFSANAVPWLSSADVAIAVMSSSPPPSQTKVTVMLFSDEIEALGIVTVISGVPADCTVPDSMLYPPTVVLDNPVPFAIVALLSTFQPVKSSAELFRTILTATLFVLQSFVPKYRVPLCPAVSLMSVIAFRPLPALAVISNCAPVWFSSPIISVADDKKLTAKTDVGNSDIHKKTISTSESVFRIPFINRLNFVLRIIT